ncbi:helix-turn-helix domain-containing protein [Paenibacillus ginsengihumi]|uniref:helix-turn-helix domain-containing protein n=1 Tax=Paenibacillus ginsengihumi TaxID=431596 RepID=UPI0003791C2B|nr:helix-turn-helix domain-containing protein [Paenibacillus ginsengihumi]
MYQVMIVEDELWIRSAVAEMVEAGGTYEVVAEAGNGEEALELIYNVWPTIVVTDIMMPGQDGLWLAREIFDRQLPVITVILTGYNEFEYARQALRYHVSDFLLKPVLEEELHRALERAQDRMPQFAHLRPFFVAIQHYLDKMTDMAPEELFAGQARLVQRIAEADSLQESEKIVLFKTFSGKMNDSIQAMNPSFQRLTVEGNRPESIRVHFQQLTEHWQRYYNALFNGEMRQVIRKACEYIQAHYAEDLSVPDMTRRFHISVSQFSVLFKKFTGRSFVNYLNELRIRQAKQLLLEGELKVYEISEKVGFNSLPHFNRVFKKLTGQSPNEYRRAMNV